MNAAPLSFGDAFRFAFRRVSGGRTPTLFSEKTLDSLFVIQGNDQGNRFALDAEVATIGRETSNKIRLRDVEASRRHAEIRPVEGGRLLVDLDSSNGVFVDGKRIRSRRLENGDRIQIGKTILLFASRASDVGASEPLVDVFQESESGSNDVSRVLHSFAPTDESRLFDRSSADFLPGDRAFRAESRSETLERESNFGGRPPEQALEPGSDAREVRRFANAKSETERERFGADAGDASRADRFERARAHLNFMYHATLAAGRTLDVEQLLDRILELIFQWAPVDRGCIFLYDADADKLVPKSSRARRKGGRVKVSQTILNYVLKTKTGVLTSNARRDERWDGAASVLQAGVKEAICVPMKGRYGFVGVIYIDVSRRLEEIAALDELSRAQSSKTAEFPAAPPFSPASKTESSLEPPDALPRLATPIIPSPESDVPPPPNAVDDSESTFALRSRKLTFEHLKLMVAIGCQAALAIEDAQFYLGLAQAERLAAIGQTVAVLSHHVKNILQGIRGGSYLIDSGLREHDETLVSKGWRIVEKNQTKISDLVLDMLTFSKEREPVWSFADFNDVLADVVELMRGRADDLDVELEYEPDPSIPPFYFDKEQIHRAIVNLVGNALEASKDYDPDASSLVAKPNVPRFARARVEIRTKLDKGSRRAVVVVDDVGPGVPVDMREAIFSPFSSKNKSGGTGLGLAVTRKIVGEHKGGITVSDSPLGGARFVVDLPLATAKPLESNE